MTKLFQIEMSEYRVGLLAVWTDGDGVEELEEKDSCLMRTSLHPEVIVVCKQLDDVFIEILVTNSTTNSLTFTIMLSLVIIIKRSYYSMWSIFILTFLIWTSVQTKQIPLSKIHLNSDGLFTDSRGFIKLFRGFNNVLKYFPWYNINSTNITQLEMFKNWGLNVVRLGVMWSGVKPTMSMVNTTYLDAIENVIDLYGDYGIYVILDMHQDALSSLYGAYDGIPLWLVEKFKRPPHHLQYPWPYKKSPDWDMAPYLTYECANGAQQLYNNVSGAWNHWGEFWEIVARRFGRKSNVLGYELINEPPPGNFYTNPLRGLPGYAGRYNLQPVYDYLVERIRKYDNSTLIFYEPVTYGVFTPVRSSGWLGTGFDRVPGAHRDKSAPSKSVLSYHYYCWILQTDAQNTTMPFWKKVICDRLLLPNVISNAIRATKSTGGGRFLTEFGLCGDDGNPRSVNTIECNNILNEADKHFESWTYWDSNLLDLSGNPIVKSFIRPYPHSIRGVFQKQQFNHETGDYHLSFIANTTKQQNNEKQTLIAEIYIPRSVHYPNGFSMSVKPDNLSTKMNENMMYVYLPSGVSNANAIENVIDLYADYGIYVILDMHQDALSSLYGAYDGIPLWLVEKFKRPPHHLQYPWPYKKSPDWDMAPYLTYECANGAQQLYNNVSGAWNHWGEFWEIVARRFGRKSNVLGYELINEPPPGNFYTNPLRGLPVNFVYFKHHTNNNFKIHHVHTLLHQHTNSFNLIFILHSLNSYMDIIPHTYSCQNHYRQSHRWFELKPLENVTNWEYVDVIERIVDNAGLYGIYIILDLHQDGLSRRLGAIDSVPHWFMDKIGRAPHYLQYPWPLTRDPSVNEWFLTYATYESGHVFESIYKNVSGIWRYLGEYWMIMTERFGNKRNLLGYNLLNEPAPGNFYKNPFLLLPHNSGGNLLSFYDYLVNMIRETDKETLIFYESVTYGIYFPFVNGIPGTGIKRVPGLLQDEMARKKSVLSYHHYCWILQSERAEDNIPSWKRYICEKILLNYAFSNVKNIIKSTGGGSFLTEFGLCFPDGNPNSINTVECNSVLNAADRNFESWTFWDQYDLFPYLNMNNNSLKSFSRVYPQSTAGHPVELRFDVDTSEFYYAFIPTQQICTNFHRKSVLVVEIFVPMIIHYPNGIRVHLKPEQLFYEIYENDSNFMFVYAPCTLSENTSIQLVEIVITPNHTNSMSNHANFKTHSKFLSMLFFIMKLLSDLYFRHL
ncbi:Endoglycoceramidase [Schistosoma japonicum]|nr:Endoglycoceramidase [Schistosoma japonicum]